MVPIKDQNKIAHFHVFFLINSLQVGIGVLGFQRIIAKSVGNDGWMVIIIAGLLSHIILFMMYKIMRDSKGDIFTVHKETFGKWIGGAISSVFIIYLLILSITVVRTYIEVIQVWMFPEINVWIFSIFIMLLAYYIITGGFRVVAGIAFFSITLTAYLILTMVFPLPFASVRNLLPFFDHSVSEFAQGTRDMTLSMIGFETLLVYYPFLKNPEKSKKWAHLGVAYTTFSYLVYGITALIFFSEGHLEKKIWATLSMWKVVELPFVERFEYVGIATWMLVILPNVCLTLWASSRGIKRLFSIRQKTALIFLSAIVVISNGLITSRKEIGWLNDTLGQFGFYYVYLYIPFLFMVILFLRKVRTKK